MYKHIEKPEPIKEPHPVEPRFEYVEMAPPVPDYCEPFYYEPCCEPCCEPEPFCCEHHVYPAAIPFDPCNPHTYACPVTMMDYGPNPFNVDIYQAALHNSNYRTALWTGCHLQLTLMCIPVCDEIGLEMHPDTDQFFCVAEGQGLALMGEGRDNLPDRQLIGHHCSIFVPAGTWHNIINTGNMPLKLFSIYAPPHHPWGTVHMSRAEAMATEG